MLWVPNLPFPHTHIKGFLLTSVGDSLSYWYSIHRNCQEDRIHHFKCRSGPIAGGNCQWLRFANDYDGSFIFKCPNDGVLTGVESEFSGQHNDRR